MLGISAIRIATHLRAKRVSDEIDLSLQDLEKTYFMRDAHHFGPGSFDLLTSVLGSECLWGCKCRCLRSEQK